jgi:hypothetical protein
VAKQTPPAEPMADVIAASSFPCADGSYVHRGQRLRLPASQAAELKTMRLARDPLPSDPPEA